MRKVYIVFAYDRYCTAGLPVDDIAGVYQTQEAADARVEELLHTYKWDHVGWQEFTVLDSDEENV